MADKKPTINLEDLLASSNSIVSFISKNNPPYEAREKALGELLQNIYALKGLGYEGAGQYLAWYDKLFLKDCGISARNSTGITGVPHAKP